MSKKAAEHHRKASEHSTQAAKHHGVGPARGLPLSLRSFPLFLALPLLEPLSES